MFRSVLDDRDVSIQGHCVFGMIHFGDQGSQKKFVWEHIVSGRPIIQPSCSHFACLDRWDSRSPSPRFEEFPRKRRHPPPHKRKQHIISNNVSEMHSFFTFEGFFSKIILINCGIFLDFVFFSKRILIYCSIFVDFVFFGLMLFRTGHQCTEDLP